MSFSRGFVKASADWASLAKNLPAMAGSAAKGVKAWARKNPLKAMGLAGAAGAGALASGGGDNEKTSSAIAASPPSPPSPPDGGRKWGRSPFESVYKPKSHAEILGEAAMAKNMRRESEKARKQISGVFSAAKKWSRGE